VYLHNQDLISKFRIFDNPTAMADTRGEVDSYLNMYETGPLTKASMLQKMNNGQGVDPEFSKKFQIKRRGKDKDDLFWMFGKVHGLENVALAD